MKTMQNIKPVKVVSSGRVKVKLFRVEVGCDVNYRFTIDCQAAPEDAMTLGELRMVEDAIRESIRDAEAAAGTEILLSRASLPRRNAS